MSVAFIVRSAVEENKCYLYTAGKIILVVYLVIDLGEDFLCCLVSISWNNHHKEYFSKCLDHTFTVMHETVVFFCLLHFVNINEY